MRRPSATSWPSDVMRRSEMRAIVHDRYGPPEVLRVDEVERPVPNDDEVLVRVHATTVTQTDCHMRRARPFFWRFMLGLRRPKRKILGLEFAGVVEEIGPSVTQFEVGDRVFGLRSGAHAEYVCVRESRLVARMPDRHDASSRPPEPATACTRLATHFAPDVWTTTRAW